MADEKTLLLRDDPLTNLDDEDRFRHKAYEETLRRIVEQVDPPFIIGLYGRWGTGKSTIAGQLRDCYAKKGKNRSAFVGLDVWKFQLDSFRRQFLLGVEHDLVEQKLMSKGRIADRLIKTRTSPTSPEFRLSWADVLATVVAFGVTLGAAAGLFFLFRREGAQTPELHF